jgi:hypothetical protein|nr:MAG TPA: hypothetical protein [Caudoviricetes sp.]
MDYISERGLRDYAYRVLKSVLGNRIENGIFIPGKMSDEELAQFVSQMPVSQLEQMYEMIYGSEMVE